MPTSAPDFYYCIDNPEDLEGECSTYITDLIRFPEHQKIGVASSPLHRYDNEYGTENFLKEFNNRLEALIFEGALLTLTERQEDQPEKLKFTKTGKRWHGITEVRKTTWSELEKVVNFLLEELNNPGFEHLAVTYIPMSKRQKLTWRESLNFLEALSDT